MAVSGYFLVELRQLGSHCGVVLSPHTKRHVRAEAMGVNARYDAWKRNVSQVMDNAEGPQWHHADRVGDIGDMFSEAGWVCVRSRFTFNLKWLVNGSISGLLSSYDA